MGGLGLIRLGPRLSYIEFFVDYYFHFNGQALGTCLGQCTNVLNHLSVFHPPPTHVARPCRS